MNKKILIVDDEINNFGFLLDALEDYGYNVISVDNGENAIKLAEENFYDLILMDYNLPGINGLEAFKRIKKISPLSVVIMMTAAAPENAINEAMVEGSFAIVNKPFKLDVMVDKIDEALAKTTAIIVDDRFSDREVLKDLLEQRGCKCVSIADGSTALEILKHEKPNIIFVDVTMPDMDGFKVLEKIKEMDPDANVIMMTAYPKDEYFEMAKKMGALTCMYKPLKIENVLKIIEKVSKKNDKVIGVKNLLLVEDDKGLNNSLAAILSENSYNVFSVALGNDAVKESKIKKYDAAIVDFRLPDISGIEVIKKIKEVNPQMIIILMSAYESIDLAMKAIKEHVFDFLVKPVDPQVLLKSLEKGFKANE